MPWHIDPDHPDCPDGYAVIQDDNGHLAGCHQTPDGADAQLRALYASEKIAALHQSTR